MKSLDNLIEGARTRLIELGMKGHPYIATNLSTLEIQAVLQQETGENDHVYLPAHHASAYLTLLAERGEKINFKNLGRDELPYLFHLGKGISGIEYNSGPMGASMPVAVSKARINPDEKSYVLLGNAEMREGRTFESLAFATADNIDNLVVMVNDNGKSLDGESTLNYVGILQGFGFEVKEVDGHDINAIREAVREARKSTRRYGIVFKTKRGHKTEFVDVAYDGTFRQNKNSSRKYIGRVIERLAHEKEFMVVAADTAKSIGLEDIALVDGRRLVNVGCSEQLLLGGLEAYQLQGIPVVAGTFAKFVLETAREQLEGLIANYKEDQVNSPTVILATHNGLSSGVNGRSHQALTSYEFIGRDNVNIYHASGETQLEAMMKEALSKPELTIILTERESESFRFKNGQRVSKYRDLYADKFDGESYYQFEPSMPEEITKFTSDNYTLIIANGLRVYDALDVAAKGKNVEVLSLPSFPMDEAQLAPYLQRAKNVVVVEESIKPYLGEKVELVGRRSGSKADYIFMYVKEPEFGPYESLVRKNRLDTFGIQERIK